MVHEPLDEDVFLEVIQIFHFVHIVSLVFDTEMICYFYYLTMGCFLNGVMELLVLRSEFLCHIIIARVKLPVVAIEAVPIEIFTHEGLLKKIPEHRPRLGVTCAYIFMLSHQFVEFVDFIFNGHGFSFCLTPHPEG